MTHPAILGHHIPRHKFSDPDHARTGLPLAFLYIPGNARSGAIRTPLRQNDTSPGIGSATNPIGSCLIPRPGLELWFIIAVHLLHKQDMRDE
jgi:hypothetical protein